MKFLIKTLGCKVNQSESDELFSVLSKRGLREAKDFEDADIVIINTCSVTSLADSKARQLVSKTLKLSKARVIVTGCSANNKNSGLEKFKEVDFFKGKQKTKIAEIFRSSTFNDRAIKPKRSRALLKIQDGCSHRCSYCIVPLVRGVSKGVSVFKILNQAKEFISEGFKEIVLTGVDIGAYRDKNKTLVQLVSKLLAIDNSFRIRLSSLEPQSIKDDFLSYFRQESRVCNHVHLPLQSGSDSILKLMNRPYTAKSYLKLAEKLKSIRDDIALTTDIIVGFPSESENDFKDTVNLAKEIGFAKIHVFRYSKREATPAYDFKNHVSEESKKERATKLRALGETLADNFKQKQVGKIAKVLVEQKEGRYIRGVSANYQRIYFKDGGFSKKTVLRGKLIRVQVSNYKDGRLFATLINN